MISAVILAHNEAHNLPRCLESLSFCDQILVVDDDSNDSTQTVSRKFKAKVIRHKLNGDFAAQRNFALNKVEDGWVLFVDADEIIPSELAVEILSAINNTDKVAFYLHRQDIIWNHEFKYGDTGGMKIIRLIKKNFGTWKGKIHEIWQASGPVGQLKNPIIHYPHPDLVQFLTSINNYSDLRAAELHTHNQRSGILRVIFYPMGKFLYLWIFKLGMFDGPPGLIHALIMSLYSFLVGAKLYLLGNGIQ